MFNNIHNYIFREESIMALIGYARTSTCKQNIELQISALKEYGCVKIYSDTKSGKNIEREGLEAL
jgi:DNA invertase Pin-like site-specific DNA recombinase